MSGLTHIAGEPEDGLQRCRRCGAVLMDNTIEWQTTGDRRALWWGVNDLVEVGQGYSTMIRLAAHIAAPWCKTALEVIPMDEMEILAALVESEINVTLTGSWLKGWSAELGDDRRGTVADAWHSTPKAAIRWLAEQALEHFPESDFAEWHKQAAEDAAAQQSIDRN